MAKRLWMAALLPLAMGAARADEAPNPSFYLVNRSASAIDRVYATPGSMPDWGNDRLAGHAVQPGQYAAIRLPADGTCKYDVLVVYASGRKDERRGLDTCAVDNLSFPLGQTGAATRTAPEGNPSFLLVNRSRAVLSELYVSPTGNDGWGEDRLGRDTVGAGATRTIQIPAGSCLYDIRAIFGNGDANEKRRLNLCQITDVRLP
ncbi:MAG: hypothetical protein RQ966_12140 [Acetobacteraceae bacterium]|nr:hypothetical protein [Acetobacteraceae bacterium]